MLADGNVNIMKDGKVSGTRPLVNMLLVFGFDVYRQEPQTTIDLVKAQGYDLTKLREDTWEGHPVYVVGAAKDDLQSRQFWVEKDTLLFVREMEPTAEIRRKRKIFASPTTANLRAAGSLPVSRCTLMAR